MEIAIGIDIGGTNTVIGCVDQDGNILNRKKFRTDKFNNFETYIHTLISNIKECISREFPADITIRGIGIGAPNGNYYKGTIEYAPNLNFKGVLPLRDLIKQFTGYENVIVNNDANAAAIGEMIFGAAKGMRDFIIITLGTGVGSGFVVNGELVLGHDGLAGEFGHTIAYPGGRQCACGKKGCVEAYCSATGIQRTVIHILEESNTPGKLRDIKSLELTSFKIYEEAVKGDNIALKAFEETGIILGRCLADAVAYTSPEAIFLFGGLAEAGELIFDPVRQSLEENLLPVFRNKVKILPSGLPGADAAVLGAAALAWKEM